MTAGGFLILILIAGICGAIGQAISGYTRGGCLFTIGMGFLGAWAGLWIASTFGLPEFLPLTIQGKSFPIVWSILGAAILSLLVGLVSSGRRN